MGAPKVIIQEIDLSTRVPSFPGVYGGMLIPNGKKGKTDEPVLCTSESQFLKLYSPDERIEVGYDLSYYSALAFFQRSDKLWVRRVVNAALYGGVVLKKTASAEANAGLVVGEDDPSSYTFGAEDCLLITGSNEGAWNNDILITLHKYYALEEFVADADDDNMAVAQDWTTGIPVKVVSTGDLPEPLEANTTYYVIRESATSIQLATSLANAIAGTEIDLTSGGSGVTSVYPADEVCKEPGAFTIRVFKSDNLNVPVETFVCSRDETHKDGFGKNIYVETVLEGSNYIMGVDNTAVDSTIQPKEILTPLALTSGSDGSAVTDSEMLQAIDDFANPDSLPVTLLMDGGWATPAYQKQGLVAVCESRKDCVALLSTPYDKEASANYLNEIVDYKKTILNANTSYAALYTPHVKIFDKFNDRSIYVSPDGYAGAVISYTAANYELWYPPALVKLGWAISNNRKNNSLIAGNTLESQYYNVTRNSMRESLKNLRIGQSASKFLSL